MFSRSFIHLPLYSCAFLLLAAGPALAQALVPGPAVQPGQNAQQAFPVIPPVAKKPPFNPNDPNQLPKEFQDERTHIHADFNALMKDNNTVQQQCAAAATVAARADCDRQKKYLQTRLDGIHARERELHRKIDFWRHKMQGLPPPTWWPQPGQQNGGANGGMNNGGTNGNGRAQPGSGSVLVPNSNGAAPAVPANLY